MDAKLVEEAWKRSNRKFYKTALEILDFDKNLAEELIQDTILQLLTTEQKADFTYTTPDMYINACIRNCCKQYFFNQFQLHKRIKKYFNYYKVYGDFYSEQENLTWREDGLSLTDEEERVLERERLLISDEREICNLYFRERKSINEISKITGKSSDTLKRYIKTIQKVLITRSDQHLIKNKDVFAQTKGRIENIRQLSLIKKDKLSKIDIERDVKIKELRYNSFNSKNLRDIRKQQLLDEWLKTQKVVKL